MSTSFSGPSRRHLLTGGAGLALAASAGSLVLPARAVAAEPATAALYQLKPPHLLEAETLVEYLRLRANQWDHNRYNVEQTNGENLGRTTVTWGRPGHPEEFENLSQCASFMTSLLQRSYGADTAYGWATPAYFNQYFPPKDGLPRTSSFPNAEDLQAGFLNASNVPHIDPVTKPVNLRPGDIVAWDYDPNAKSTPYTGHTVLIRAYLGTYASSVDSKLGITGVVPHLFQIVDCTNSPHGGPDLTSQSSIDRYRAYPDSRAEIADDNSTYTEHSGVGYGHMIFYADPDTSLFVGYRWSVNSGSPQAAVAQPVKDKKQIAAGRVNAFLV
ncbi:hypothetical protein [Streptomyces sp. Ag109_G2-15]|uniref:hypothetical protein n=1 Tax=Streptomyces sp. Ag109_G2-15 TaxID=1938850 RepID=UPI000BD82596|nr:hypothetical protein [Streptomyces sp. Ag109_G2-15]SOE06830.1 hypothetical protein SAMN06272765_7698 [Streptomyces sp. Ag109_G2-15]